MGDNLNIYLKGIKCDNPKCNFVDMSVEFEDYENWLNKPCPLCGENLLTQKDYNACKFMMSMSRMLNKLPTLSGKKVVKQMSLNGEGIAEMKTGKYNNIYLVEGDITTMKFDVIVNAANSTLLGGGGVDGAIHKAAGPELKAECLKLGGCHVGEAKLTKGYNLPSPFIIHTVAPQYNKMDNKSDASRLLRNCYKNSLQLAVNNNLTNIAFPCIGTGVYKFPKKEAAFIALNTILKFMETYPDIIVSFVCFEKEDYDIYKELLFK